MELETKKIESMRAVADLHSQKRKRRRRRRRNICIGVTVALTLVVTLLFVVLALTVFKAKRPITTLDSIALKDFNLSLDMAMLRVHLNVTLLVDLCVRNPNKVGFKYTNSSALLKYRGGIVGEAQIPAGKMGADEKADMNVTLTVFADQLVYNSNLYPDVISGKLPLTTYTRVAGKVRILKLLNIKVVSYSSCDLVINVVNGSLGQEACSYKTKF